MPGKLPIVSVVFSSQSSKFLLNSPPFSIRLSMLDRFADFV